MKKITTSRSEASQLILSRISLSKILFEAVNVASDFFEAFRVFRRDLKKWRQYNVDLLEDIFQNVEIVDGYASIGKSDFALGIHSDYEVFSLLEENVGDEITFLESLIERLPFFQETLNTDIQKTNTEPSTVETVEGSSADFKGGRKSYKKIKSIGEGGCGYVYKVKDESGKFYALKILKDDVAVDDKRKRFLNEVEFCVESEHQDIVRILDFGYHGGDGIGAPFYVMPLFDANLEEYLKDKVKSEDLIEIFKCVLAAVEHAHGRGTFHRDLKPENILINRSPLKVALCDWGIAHVALEQQLTHVETIPKERLCNYRFASPEQKKKGNATRVDHRSDIFSLGSLLNYMFTGDVPEGAGHPTVKDINPAFAAFDDLIEKMRGYSPDMRPASVSEVIKEVNRIMQGLEGSVPPSATMERRILDCLQDLSSFQREVVCGVANEKLYSAEIWNGLSDHQLRQIECQELIDVGILEMRSQAWNETVVFSFTATMKDLVAKNPAILVPVCGPQVITRKIISQLIR